MKIDRIHHVAYRCRDAKENVEWYGLMLNMDFVLTIAEDQVPSTREPDPYMHIFLDAGGGNVLAFFELPTKPAMGRDPKTPDCVQHVAFKVKDRATLLEYRAHLEKNGVEVLGVTDHGAFIRSTSSIPAVTVSSWRALIQRKRLCCNAWTRSSGRCSRNGARPSVHPSMPPSCTNASSRSSLDVQPNCCATESHGAKHACNIMSLG